MTENPSITPEPKPGLVLFGFRIEAEHPFADLDDSALASIAIKRFVFAPGLWAVRFVSERMSPDWFAVLHPSAKEPDRWQLSTFDEQGAIGDLVRDTPEQAVWDYGIMPDGWATVAEVVMQEAA